MNWITACGLVAAFCTTTSFLPQAIKTFRTKDTSGISLSMYILFTFGTLLWFLYGIASHNIPVSLANGITLVLASAILYVKIKQTIAGPKR
jgi:MtN3 and saliva related transmembrane protein